MSKFQDEMEKIRPSDALVQDTMRRMHAENAKRKQEAETSVRAFPATRRAMLIAASFAVLLLAGWFVRSASSAPVTKLSSDVDGQGAFAAYKGESAFVEQPMDVATFSRRAQTDFVSLMPGYDCVSSEIIAFMNATGESILGDYAVFVYKNGAECITITSSTTDPVAPTELLAGAPVQRGNAQVRFGSAADGRVCLAAWSYGGAAFLARSDTVLGRTFITSVSKAVETLSK